MNTSKIENDVAKLNANAQRIGSGVMHVDGQRIHLQFENGNWISIFQDGEEKAWNTRSIKTAKKWIREYFQN